MVKVDLRTVSFDVPPQEVQYIHEKSHYKNFFQKNLDMSSCLYVFLPLVQIYAIIIFFIYTLDFDKRFGDNSSRCCSVLPHKQPYDVGYQC